MARYWCECGQSMRFEPTGFWLLTDFELIDIQSGDQTDPQKNIMVCPVCSRVHWFEGNELIKTFVLEKDLRPKDSP